jgi:antitoxin MazE
MSHRSSVSGRRARSRRRVRAGAGQLSNRFRLQTRGAPGRAPTRPRCEGRFTNDYGPSLQLHSRSESSVRKFTLYRTMYGMKAAIQKIGNSRGIVLPKPAIARLGLVDSVDLVVESDRIIITCPRVVREGWAQAAARIGESPLDREDHEWLDAPFQQSTIPKALRDEARPWKRALGRSRSGHRFGDSQDTTVRDAR